MRAPVHPDVQRATRSMYICYVWNRCEFWERHPCCSSLYPVPGVSRVGTRARSIEGNCDDSMFEREHGEGSGVATCAPPWPHKKPVLRHSTETCAVGATPATKHSRAQKPVERSKDASRRPIAVPLGCKLEYALSSTSLARSAERVCGRAGWAVRCRSVPSMVRCPCPYFCQCMRAVKQVFTTVSVGEPVVRDVRRRRRRVGVCGSDRV